MKRSDEIKDIACALAKAQQAIEGAVKGNVNPAFRSKYADLGAVWDAIREPLTGHGISVLQQLTTEDNRVACTTLLMHSSGQWIEFSPFAVPVSKQDAQGFGSAATYCRRYSLMAAVGIAPIDDDGNGTVGRDSRPRSKAIEEDGYDVSQDRRVVVRRVADACIAKHAAGDEWGCFEEAEAITDSEEKRLLWSYLHDHSKVRSCIKAMSEAAKQKAPA